MSRTEILSAPSSETTQRQTHGDPVQLINHRLTKESTWGYGTRVWKGIG